MTFPERFSEIVVEYPRKIILSDANGAYSAEQIFHTAAFVAAELLGHRKFKGERIALMAPPGLAYVSGMLAGWMSGAMMVPLCTEHPKPELEHVIADAQVKLILCHASLKDRLPQAKIPVVWLDVKPQPTAVPFNWDYPQPGDDALMLYTSGTTGKPKGVVHTHASLVSQIVCLVDAWEWTSEDSILHFLPLHHTHGIINKLLCALWAGAYCNMLEKFDAEITWKKIAAEKFSLFMAVPTVYVKLIQHWENSPEKEKLSAACANFRLMVSGSAALPVSVLEKWRSVSGQVLLERYGMTETGMVLSNPLRGERRPGFVGNPLPGMEVRLADDNGEILAGEDITGELQVRGENIFKSYWGNPGETKKSFTKDGWFKTGDLCVFENGAYRIAGRISTDIIKSGGYKISALEIEAALLTHEAVKECAVIGLPDETWGEKIAAVVVLKENVSLSLEELREWAKEKLAGYKLPSVLKIVEQLPRNAMGKVLKGMLK
jgi:malonyl-CoA/methylmalonyl-CoA synthetase